MKAVRHNDIEKVLELRYGERVDNFPEMRYIL